jgi:hypothetical protein
LLLRAEGFSCSSGVLKGDLGISKLQFLIKKIKIKFSVVNLGHQTLNSDPESGSAIRKNAGSGSALNQCRSATLTGAIIGGSLRRVEYVDGLLTVHL